jgi:hypothetical protein
MAVRIGPLKAHLLVRAKARANIFTLNVEEALNLNGERQTCGANICFHMNATFLERIENLRAHAHDILFIRFLRVSKSLSLYI